MKNLNQLKEYFWNNVVIKSKNECWIWRKCRTDYGYGKCGIGGANLLAHRIAWKLTYGDPGKLFVCHKCDNPPCCNPNHLFLGTPKDNTNDCMKKGRFTLNIRRGENKRGVKLTNEAVKDVWENYQKYKMPVRFFREKYKVSKSTIESILIGRNWKHITGAKQS